jgi:hypothetical protein
MPPGSGNEAGQSSRTRAHRWIDALTPSEPGWGHRNDCRPTFALVSASVEPPAGIEPATPSLPSMRRGFATLCNTSRPRTTAPVKAVAEDWVERRREVVCSAVSGKSLARSRPHIRGVTVLIRPVRQRRLDRRSASSQPNRRIGLVGERLLILGQGCEHPAWPRGRPATTARPGVADRVPTGNR